MTGQTEAHRLVTWLKNEGAWHQMTLGDVEAAGRALLRLQAENLELRKDAERYQWLRERYTAVNFDWEESGLQAVIFTAEDFPIASASCDETIDAAIDAAKDTQ